MPGGPLLLPAGFERIRHGHLELAVRRDVGNWLVPILRAAPHGWPQQTVEHRRGGRGAVVILRSDDFRCLIRPYRRGGLPAWVLRTLYFGRRPRPFLELVATESLRTLGVPVAEIYGAAVQWVLPGCYRGWLASRYIAESRTLWEWARHPAADNDRSAVYGRVGQAVRALHDAGGHHPDLNLNNILVYGDTGTPQVCLIDFDRARLGKARSAEVELTRLERSACKLDPQRRFVRDEDLTALRRAYAAATAQAVAVSA